MAEKQPSKSEEEPTVSEKQRIFTDFTKNKKHYGAVMSDFEMMTRRYDYSYGSFDSIMWNDAGGFCSGNMLVTVTFGNPVFSGKQDIFRYILYGAE